MKTANKTQLIEATLTAVAVLGLAAVVVPATGTMAAGVLVTGGLIAMGTIESKKRAY